MCSEDKDRCAHKYMSKCIKKSRASVVSETEHKISKDNADDEFSVDEFLQDVVVAYFELKVSDCIGCDHFLW